MLQNWKYPKNISRNIFHSYDKNNIRYVWTVNMRNVCLKNQSSSINPKQRVMKGLTKKLHMQSGKNH